MNADVKREPNPKGNLNDTPFNSLNQLQETSEPTIMDNDIFSGLDKLAKPKRDPESKPEKLPPLTPASSMVDEASRGKNVASSIPDKILLMSKTPNNSLRNSNSPQVYSPSESLPSDMLFPDLAATSSTEASPTSKPATILPTSKKEPLISIIPEKKEPVSIIPAKIEEPSTIPEKNEPVSIIPPIASEANEAMKMPEPTPVKDVSVSIPSSAPDIQTEEDSGP